jgi:hypothetical protein
MVGAIGDAAQYAAMCFILNGLTGRAPEGQGAVDTPVPVATGRGGKDASQTKTGGVRAEEEAGSTQGARRQGHRV